MRHRKVPTLLFTAILLTAVGAISAQSTFTGPGFNPTDGGGYVPASCSTVTVSGITANTTVQSVGLTISHTKIGDLLFGIYRPGSAPPPSIAELIRISSPPDLRECNLLGTYLITDTAAQSIDEATTGCTDTDTLTPGSYRASTYGGGTANGGVISLTSIVGPLTPAQSNGDWLVCAFDFAAGNVGAVTSTTITLVGPSAAGTSVSGRVTTADGRGITNAIVQMTAADGTTVRAMTSAFGYYRFEDVTAGATYVIGVASKRYGFTPRSITVSDELTSVDFVAEQ